MHIRIIKEKKNLSQAFPSFLEIFPKCVTERSSVVIAFLNIPKQCNQILKINPKQEMCTHVRNWNFSVYNILYGFIYSKDIR
jgi:hypothetical protein